MRRAYTTLPNEKAFTIWFSMAPLRALPDMAFSLQSEIYLASYVAWESPDGRRAVCRAGWRSAMADLEPVTVGQYLGDSDLSRRQVRFMSDEAWPRLQEIRAERDPDGLFVGYLAGPGGATNRNHWEPLVEEGRCIQLRARHETSDRSAWSISRCSISPRRTSSGCARPLATVSASSPAIVEKNAVRSLTDEPSNTTGPVLVCTVHTSTPSAPSAVMESIA